VLAWLAFQRVFSFEQAQYLQRLRLVRLCLSARFLPSSLTSFRRAFTVMESQAFCADAIMSIADWRTADPSQLRLLLQFFVAST